MNEIEKAIEHFHYGITHDIFSEPVTTYARLAVEALREKQERDKGCEYCNREDIAETVCYIPLDNGYSVDIPYHSCSNCGKQLEVEHGKRT